MNDCEMGYNSSTSNKLSAIKNVFKWLSPLEYILIFIGFLSAIVVGISVPSAVFFVGEVVTLFITNRRARLSVLLQEGKQHTDYKQQTDQYIHTLAHDIEQSVHFAQSHINTSLTVISHNNHTLKEELDLNFQLNEQFEASLHTLCFCLLFVSLCQLITGFLTTFLFDLVIARVCERLRHVLFHSTNLDNSQSDQTSNGHNKSLSDDVGQVEKGFNNNFGLLVSAIVTFISSIALSFYKKWQLALILFPYLILKLYGIGFVVQLKKSTVIKFKRGYALITSQLLDTLQAVPTVVAFSQEDVEVKRYQLQLKKLTKYIQKNAIISGFFNGLILMATHLLNATMLWYGVRLIIADLRSEDELFRPGSLVVVFFSFLRGLSTFTQASSHYPVLKNAFKALARVGKALQFYVYQNDGLLISIADHKKHKSFKPKPSITSKNRLLGNKTAIERIVLHNSNCQADFSTENIRQTFITLKFLRIFWPYIIFGSLGSVLLGSTIPATFYIFCEVIGSMANLEDEIVFERTNQMLVAFFILSIVSLIGTILQHYMLQVLGYLYSNKLRTTLLNSYLNNYGIKTTEDFELLFKENVDNIEIAVISAFGTGVEIISAVFVALPLAASVVWSQAFILSYIFPTLFAVFFLQYVTEKKEMKMSSFPEKVSECFRNSLLWGFIRAFREMAFATILFFGAYLIIHHGENNKNVLQVNLIMINTAMQISQLNAVGFSIKNGWKSARSIENFLFHLKLNSRKQSQAQIPNSPYELTLIDTQLDHTIILNSGQKAEIQVEDKNNFFLNLLLGKSLFEGQMLISNCEIRNINLTWIRRNITLISDEIQFLFPSRTLYENVCYGKNSNNKSFEVVEDLADFQDWDTALNSVSPKIISSYHKSLILSRCLSQKNPIVLVDEDYLTQEIKIEANQMLVIIKEK